MWFPKKKDNIINQLVSEINGCFGGTYFTVSMIADGNANKYVLNLTNLATSTNQYGFILVNKPLRHNEIYMYLLGILNGFRAAKAQK